MAMLAALAEWSIAYGLEVSVVPLGSRELFGAVKYLGIGVLGPAWVAFTLRSSAGDRYVTKRVLAVLMIEPILVLILLAHRATHDWVRYYPPERRWSGIRWSRWAGSSGCT
jgi:hypothetical protein